MQPKWRQPGPSSESRGNCLRAGQAHSDLHTQPAQGDRCSQASSRKDHSSILFPCIFLLTRTFLLSVTPTLRDRAGAPTAYLWAKGESAQRNTQLPLARTLPRWRTLNQATTGCSLRKTCRHSKDTVIWREKAEGGSCARQPNTGGTSRQKLELKVCHSAAMVTGATAEMCPSTRCVMLPHFFSFSLLQPLQRSLCPCSEPLQPLFTRFLISSISVGNLSMCARSSLELDLPNTAWCRFSYPWLDHRSIPTQLWLFDGLPFHGVMGPC
jgi:hypothetical protein